MNCFICLSIHCFRTALHHPAFERSSPSEKSLQQRAVGPDRDVSMAWRFFLRERGAVLV